MHPALLAELISAEDSDLDQPPTAGAALIAVAVDGNRANQAIQAPSASVAMARVASHLHGAPALAREDQP